MATHELPLRRYCLIIPSLLVEKVVLQAMLTAHAPLPIGIIFVRPLVIHAYRRFSIEHIKHLIESTGTMANTSYKVFNTVRVV